MRTISLVLILLVMTIPSILRGEEPVGVNALYVQTALDNDGNIHMTYVDDNWGSVFYKKYNRAAGTWTPTRELAFSTPCVWPFNFPDIAVGPNGKAQVVYGTTTGAWPEDLDGAYLAQANDADGNSFTYTLLCNYDARRGYTDIAVDESNQPHITYEKTSRSQDPQNWYWQIAYRRPDGEEVSIQFLDSEFYLCHNPAVAYHNGIVHVAWYEGGSSTGTNNIFYSSGAPYGQFSPPARLTNTGFMEFAYPPAIAVNPVDSDVQIVFLGSNWNWDPPQHTGLYLTKPGWTQAIVLDPDWAEIDTSVGEGFEDQIPNITFDNGGTRFVSWSYFSDREAYYLAGDQKYTLEPYGQIDVCGRNGAFFARVVSGNEHPGPVYFQELAGGPPPNQAPVAVFTFSPETGDFETLFNFDASGSYDPDNNLPLTYSWDWETDGNYDIVDQLTATASHTFGYPGDYTVTLRVKDALGATGTASDDVNIINHPPMAAFDYEQAGEDTIQFDASLSYDPEDETLLWYRWDWDNDGNFEQWTIFSQATWVFDGPGSYPVTLEVKDQLSAVGDTLMTVEVEAIPPLPPDSLFAKDNPDDQGGMLLVTWQLSFDDTSRGAVTDYTLERFADDDTVFVAVLPAGTTSYVDTVPNAEPFWYRLAASDGVTYSPWIETEEPGIASDNIAPDPAIDLQATIEFSEPAWLVSLTWTPSASEDVITQSVYRSDEGGEWFGLVTLQPTETSFSDTIVVAGSYAYRIGTSDAENITFSDSVEVPALGASWQPGMPTALTLATVSPNPGRGVFTVRFGVPRPGTAELTAHDLTGRVMALDKIRCSQAGWVDHNWEPVDRNGRGLPTGVYVFRVTLDHESVMTPGVIIR